MLSIRCKNNNRIISCKEGISLQEIIPLSGVETRYPVISARVNNVSQGLKFRLYQNRDVELLDLTDPSAMRVYVRSLSFVLCKAAQDIFPGCKVFIEHSISKGYYCNFARPQQGGGNAMQHGLDAGEVELIRQRMQEIIDADMPFQHHEVPKEDAISMFRECGYTDKVRLLETSDILYSEFYTLGDTKDYYYGALVPSTGFLKVFGLTHYGDNGMLLRIPSSKNPEVLEEMIPQPKTFDIYKEQVKWNVIMRLSNAGDVNKACLDGQASSLIFVAEALQEKKIVKIAEEIEKRFMETGLRLVLITGPSSSGKTTFCQRLSIQLMACGLRPVSFSTDDYFVNRVDSPLLPNGKYDFDNFETVDHRLLSEHLLQLQQGKEVEIPEYNFATGMREYNGKRMRLSDKSILIIEGIHALNPRLTESISNEGKYKIFISALTSISLDNHNLIPTRDNRLLRRIIRDNNKGAFSARETIAQWPSVCDGEGLWIEPFQEDADIMFNSALNIEFALLRNHAEPILASVPRNCPEYAEAHRLLKFLRYFTPISDKEIPPTSIMREFVGGSGFKTN